MIYTQETFYKSKEWERFRQIIIADSTADDGYVYCSLCGKPIVKKYDLIIDHIDPITEANVNDVTVTLNPDNVRCMHFKCHNRRHERFGKNNYMNKVKHVYIVYGAPLSGKSSWVNEVATPNDIVVDMDNIYQMISTNSRYIKPNRLNGVAFSVRDHLYDMIRYRSGKWNDAYIITGGARSGDRQRLKDRVNADELIYIECDKQTCIDRLSSSLDKRGDEWLTYINEWYDAYEPDQ